MPSLFANARLKRGYRNHDAFCDGPGFPLLGISDENVVACKTADP